MVVGKHEIEAALYTEKQEISAGRLKEDNPLDDSEDFWLLCEAVRRNDLKTCQEKIQEGVNINARDRFDYTPLILASLCGHYNVVELLLESGALCERDTFQGERCLYNALTDQIRNLLLSYDFSKSRDPLQPLAAHITSLLGRDTPQISDITLTTDTKSFRLHKFILSARSPYFAKKLAASPETTSWKVPSSIPTRSLEIAIVALYLGEISLDLSASDEDQAVLAGIEKLSRHLEIGDLFETILESDRRLARQKRTEEVEKGRDQLQAWFNKVVLGNRLRIDAAKADEVKWDRQNSMFADVLLCAEDDDEDEDEEASFPSTGTSAPKTRTTNGPLNGIPIGPLASTSSELSHKHHCKQATLFPTHIAMLLRSDYFTAMFTSPFKESLPTPHLPIIHIDCSPAVLSTILTYLYTESANFPLETAISVLFTADQLFIEKLKVKAAVIISTLGNGAASVVDDTKARGATGLEDVLDIYDVVRAAWDVRVRRLEEFGARYIAYRLERYIDEAPFRDLVMESAARIQNRQETDTVELIDDIRHYLSERFRLRFEDTNLDDLLTDAPHPDLSEATPDPATLPEPPALDDGIMVSTIDGQEVSDEFAQDALDYRILLGKIDVLLEGLKLDA